MTMKRVWARTGFGPTSLAATTRRTDDLLLNLEAATGRTLGDLTVTRIIGRVGAFGSAVTLSPGRFSAGIMVNQKGTTLATGVDPDDVDLGADWMWVDSMFRANSITGGVQIPGFDSGPLDVRGQRQIKGYNQSLFLEWNNASALAVQIHVHLRILCLLH